MRAVVAVFAIRFAHVGRAFWRSHPRGSRRHHGFAQFAVHAGSLVIEGDATNARFTRVPQNKFKIESRVVECIAELRKRGVAKELIKPAVEATRAHVGQQDLPARQWIDIALTKLPTKEPSR